MSKQNEGDHGEFYDEENKEIISYEEWIKRKQPQPPTEEVDRIYYQEESEEGCWWIKGKGGDKCWEENCGCSAGEEEEELEECDQCGHEDITECMSNKCRDLEAEEQQKAQEIIEKIKHEIPYVDIKPYSHNIITLQLGYLEEVAGREAVVELVQTTELKNKGWGFITSIGGVGENLNV